jgi:hypothetical protein
MITKKKRTRLQIIEDLIDYNKALLKDYYRLDKENQVQRARIARLELLGLMMRDKRKDKGQ